MKLAFEQEVRDDGTIQFAILDGDDVLWPHRFRDDGWSDFEPEDVLSYLSDAWPSLLLSQSWPVIFDPEQEPRSMTGLLRAADERWEQGVVSDAQIGAETAEIDAFLYRHDLASMKYGAGLPSFYVLRQGTTIRIETGAQVFEALPFEPFRASLEKLGLLAEMLVRRRDSLSGRGVAERWARRDIVEPMAATALISALTRPDLDHLPDISATLFPVLAGRSLTEIANDNATPVLAVARSSGGLGPAGLLAALDALRSLPDGCSTMLSSRRRALLLALRGTHTPLEQGVRAANLTRDWLGQRQGTAIDLDALSARLDVAIVREEKLDRRIDGLASIGPNHGPAIVLNVNTLRRGSTEEDLERALRFTWAHELGHLLLDGDDWPALIDAARQRVPRAIETRANAFAAYLLLPIGEAYRRIEHVAAPLDWAEMEPLLNGIGSDFGVTRILASRQAARGAPGPKRRALEDLFRLHVANFDGRGR